MSHSCDPKDCSPPGSFVLEWVAISLLQGIFLTQGLNLSFFRLLHRQVDSLLLSHWGSPAQALTIAFMHSCMLSHSVVSNSLQPHKDNPLSMGFSRQEYWSGLPFPSPRDLPNPGIKPASPALAGRFFTIEPLGKPIFLYLFFFIFKILGCAKQNGKSQFPDQGSHPLPAPPTPLH